MDLLWQQIVIGVAVFGAIGYLVRRAIRPPEKETTCSRCHCKKKDLVDRSGLRRL